MLNNEFKKSATEKLKSMNSNELKKAFKAIGSLQTNDEWRKTCSEEDFAEAMTKVVLNIVSWNNDPKPSEVRNVLKSWLKQPHQKENEK